jgi:hypothetical protein
MITWHARVYKLRNTALPSLTGPTGVSPEHAGALRVGGGEIPPATRQIGHGVRSSVEEERTPLPR